MQRVAVLGAMNANSITKKTTMLVIGLQDPTWSRVVISQGSAKERKALQYIAAGQIFQVVSEKELLGWLDVRAGTVSQLESTRTAILKGIGSIRRRKQG